MNSGDAGVWNRSMASASSAAPGSTPIGEWRLPFLGVLLTALGALLLSAGIGEMVFSAFPASSVAYSSVAGTTMQSQIVPVDPARTVRNRARGGVWSGASTWSLVALGRSRASAGCLGADVATGRRAESAHLATVPLLRPADCGDARDAITALAALRYTSPSTDADPRPPDVAADPSGGVDVVAAALYGPPDRQPQAKMEDAVLDGGRGRTRRFLEETAATRGRTPWARLILGAGPE